MSSQSIPTTAALRTTYIPKPMDVQAFRRDRAPTLEALKLRRSEVPEEEEAIAKLIAEEAAAIETGAAAIERKYPNPIEIVLRIPTSIERDQVNIRLIQLGLAPVDELQIRATMIDELFYYDWGKGDANEAYAEELANFLDGCWQRQEVHDAAIAQWQEQERERVMDETQGAPPRARAELPVKLLTVREQAKLRLLIDQMMADSQRMRDLAARAADYNRVNGVLLVRMHVLRATTAFGKEIPIEVDPVVRALTDASLAALREELDDASWYALVAHVDGMYRLDGGEVKNSDSPLGKASDPSGSPAPIVATASSDGNSTSSFTTLALAAESEPTTEPSLPSTSDSGIVAETETKSSPTDEA